MSDLQIALGTIGILVVGGVYVFNAWQERKLRQRLERAFGSDRDDVLLNSKGGTVAEPSGPRIEPRIGGGMGEESAVDPGIAGDAVTTEPADPVIEFVADIDLLAPVNDAAVHELQSLISVFGKPARILGRDDDSNHLQAVLQLVNRAGPVHAPQLSGFCDAVQAWASRHQATVEMDDLVAALDAARVLDELCGKVDVAIGFNVVAAEGSAFPGEQVAAAASAAGFQLQSDGLFYLHDATGQPLFALENHESEPFTQERLAAMQTSGLTLLLDVPRSVDGEAALDEMARAGSELAEALGGFVVDDNRVPLQAAGIARIKSQLKSIQDTMTAHEIPAGSPRAQRLFA